MFKKKTTTAKKTVSKRTVKTRDQKIVEQYNTGMNYAQLAEAHKLSVEEVSSIVEA